MTRASWGRVAGIQIDSSALQHNLQRVKALAPASKIMAVIKANAYGHGVLTAAAALEQADAFALAMPGEAIALRKAGIDKPLVVLHGFANREELQLCAEYRLQTVIHQAWQAELLGSADVPLDVWLKIDTGMHRLGIPLQQVDSVYRQLRDSDAVGEIRLMTHFANADDPSHSLNNKQLEEFIKVTSQIDAERSMANSAAIVALPDSHFDWVRPGIMLYGSSPLLLRSAAELELKPVMQLESRIAAVQQVGKGESIGYGSAWRCPEDMPVGVVAIGYGDGYPRHAPAGTPVWVNGQLCPVIGRISMDSITVDLRPLYDQGNTVTMGERVVLWGDAPSVDTIAQHTGTIAYELLCHVGNSAQLT